MGQPQDCQKLSFSPQIRSTPPWEGPQRWTRVTETEHAEAALYSLPGSAKASSRARDELCVPAAGEELGARSRSRSLKPTSRPRAPQSVQSPLSNTHTYSRTNPHNSRGLFFPADGSPKNLVSQSGEMCVTAQGHLPAVPAQSRDPAPYQVIPKDKVMPSGCSQYIPLDWPTAASLWLSRPTVTALQQPGSTRSLPQIQPMDQLCDGKRRDRRCPDPSGEPLYAHPR